MNEIDSLKKEIEELKTAILQAIEWVNIEYLKKRMPGHKLIETVETLEKLAGK